MGTSYDCAHVHTSVFLHVCTNIRMILHSCTQSLCNCPHTYVQLAQRQLAAAFTICRCTETALSISKEVDSTVFNICPFLYGAASSTVFNTPDFHSTLFQNCIQHARIAFNMGSLMYGYQPLDRTFDMGSLIYGYQPQDRKF